MDEYNIFLLFRSVLKTREDINPRLAAEWFKELTLKVLESGERDWVREYDEADNPRTIKSRVRIMERNNLKN